MNYLSITYYFFAKSVFKFILNLEIMSREHNIDKTKYQLSHLRSHGSWLDNERFSTDAAAAG